MTNEEFLKEALGSPGCPEDFEKEYAYFCTYQQMALDTLREFARVCGKNGVRYQLAFGSLLGAVRDGGQIPWDYDVDVIVPFFEKDRLIEALERDLDERYCFYAPGLSPHYKASFVRVVPKGYPHQMLHVDVFYALGIPDGERERLEYCKEVRSRYKARAYVVQDLKEYSYSARAKLIHTVKKWYYLLKYGKRAAGDNSEFFSRYDIRETQEAIVMSVNVGKIIFPAGIFTETVKLTTRDGVFSAPADHGAFLTIKYGDWRKYYPVENRIAEVEKHCRQFRWYEERLGIHP